MTSIAGTLSTRSLSRALSPAAWTQPPIEIDPHVRTEVVARCRSHFPEFATWPDQALANAYCWYWLECVSDVVEPPQDRDIDFLLYLFVIQFYVPSGVGDFAAKGAPLVRFALQEVESIWLGDNLPVHP